MIPTTIHRSPVTEPSYEPEMELPILTDRVA